MCDESAVRAWCFYGVVHFIQHMPTNSFRNLLTGECNGPVRAGLGDWIRRAERVAIGCDFCALDFVAVNGVPRVLHRCIPYPKSCDVKCPSAERQIVELLMRMSLALSVERQSRGIKPRRDLLRWPTNERIPKEPQEQLHHSVFPHKLPVQAAGGQTIAVMTAFFGDSDTPQAQPVPHQSDVAAWFAFTDPERASDPSRLPPAPWKVIVVPKDDGVGPRRQARRAKHNYSSFVVGFDSILWVDATICLKQGPTDVVKAYLKPNASGIKPLVGMNEHSECRSMGYLDECLILIQNKMHNPKAAKNQLDLYQAEGIPIEVPAPSLETSIYVRDATAKSKEGEPLSLVLGKLVMKEMESFTERDQIGIYKAWHTMLKSARNAKGVWARIVPWMRLNDWAVCRPHEIAVE